MVQPRREILNIDQTVHGSADPAELAAYDLDPQSVIDFSSNVNPYGPSPRVYDAIRQADPSVYPDRRAAALVEKIASHTQVAPRRLVAGSGTTELLYLLSWAYIRPDDTTFVLAPTYSEYARLAAMAGCRVHAVEMGLQHAADWPEQVAKRLRERRPRMALLCNPNNPTGHLFSRGVIVEWVKQSPETLFVVDEAYIEFVPQAETLAREELPNLVVLRSMTKAYALAGLRLGYAVAPEDVCRALDRIRPPWSVNAVAQAAGAAALDDQQHLQESLARMLQAKRSLTDQLKRFELRPHPSSTHFFLLPVGDGHAVRHELLRRKILVRDCASFGLASYIRISTRRPEENAALIKELRRIVSC